MKKKSILKYTLLNNLRKQLKLNKFQRSWMRTHTDSELIPMNCFPKEVVETGCGSYGELNIVTFDSKTKLKVGRYVSIAQNVTFLLDVEHYTNHISTYPWKVKLLGQNVPETFSKGDIIIGDDVWIGYGAIIMSGVHVGQGAVIAAGAVVVKDVPPYAIVGGVPAKVIKYRFDDGIINKLRMMNFEELDCEKVKNNLHQMYIELTQDNVSDVLQRFERK